jgi:hypothetical protein
MGRRTAGAPRLLLADDPGRAGDQKPAERRAVSAALCGAGWAARPPRSISRETEDWTAWSALGARTAVAHVQIDAGLRSRPTRRSGSRRIGSWLYLRDTLAEPRLWLSGFGQDSAIIQIRGRRSWDCLAQDINATPLVQTLAIRTVRDRDDVHHRRAKGRRRHQRPGAGREP